MELGSKSYSQTLQLKTSFLRSQRQQQAVGPLRTGMPWIRVSLYPQDLMQHLAHGRDAVQVR